MYLKMVKVAWETIVINYCENGGDLTPDPFNIEKILNRSLPSLYIEWWLHNLGYYLTKPLCAIPYFKALNKRFKDVDLEEHR